MSLPDLKALCVDGFPASQTRNAIMQGFEFVVDRLRTNGIAGRIWVDGSFVTEKIDPDDSDIALEFEGLEYDQGSALYQAHIDWLNTDLKQVHRCDSYIIQNYPEGHRCHESCRKNRKYWLGEFTFNRKDEPRGIAVVVL